MLFVDETLPKPPTPPAPTPTGPQMPWTVRECEGLAGRVFRCKEWPGGMVGEILSKDEEKIVGYVAHLESENQRLKAELAVANETRVLLDAGPPQPATPTPTPGENAISISNDVPLANTEAATDPRRQRAEEELLKSPGDSNGIIGERIGASDEFVRKIRKQLIETGRLEASVVTRRSGQHQALGAGDGPAVTPSEVPAATT